MRIRTIGISFSFRWYTWSTSLSCVCVCSCWGMEQPLVIYRSVLSQSNGFDCSLLKALMILFVLSLSFCPALSLLLLFFTSLFLSRRVMGMRTCESRCLFSGSKGEVCCVEPLHAAPELKDHPITHYCLLAMASLTKVSLLSSLSHTHTRTFLFPILLHILTVLDIRHVKFIFNWILIFFCQNDDWQ